MRRMLAVAGLLALLTISWNNLVIFEDGSYALGIASTDDDGWYLDQVWATGCLPHTACSA